MPFNLFNRDPGKDIKPTTKVYRTQIATGYAVPAVIHNMNYFFVDLDVFENGRVNCWNFEDFDRFQHDVKRGWVVTAIPDGEDISVHGLGTWSITDGKWLFSKDSFIAYVRSIIKGMNPGWENIHKYRKKKINGVSVGESGTGTPYKENPRSEFDTFPKKVDGDSVHLFYKNEDGYYLSRVTAFADGIIQISRLPTVIEANFTELERMVESGVISTSVPVGATVQIYGLGSFTVKSTKGNADMGQKMVEIRDMLTMLKGEPSAIEVCRQALENYRQNPTAVNRDTLKLAYESIAEHLRMYVGDMDKRDVEVRMIIYGEQEIENWSHYKAAKAKGLELPTIEVPKVRDAGESG